MLPFYDKVGIWKRQRAFRGHAETYDVEIVERKSLSDSFFRQEVVLLIYFQIYHQKKKSF